MQLGDLGHAERGLIEHAVHTRRPVAVRRDLGDEEQLRTGHRVAPYGRRARASRTGSYSPRWSSGIQLGGRFSMNEVMPSRISGECQMAHDIVWVSTWP